MKRIIDVLSVICLAGIMMGLLLAGEVIAAQELSLPDPLKTQDGKPVNTPAQWQQDRRGEILELFREHVYGRAPVERPDDLRFETVEIQTKVLDGAATGKSIAITFSGPGGKGQINLSIFVPNHMSKPVGGFVLINNRREENIRLDGSHDSGFWPVRQIVQRGYFAAAFDNSDLDPDSYDAFMNGVHGIFHAKDTPRPPDAWATIAAWAWGASRVMDYLETDKDVDASRVAVIGHSRSGKTALWAGANDERFALVISNDSGCTGAALARRRQGEMVAKINKNFPHWFCENYKKYNDAEDTLPIDQHELIALMAPRLVYVASASDDAWADPEGEFLSCVYAGAVYELFGLTGLGTATMPKPDTPVQIGHIGYHIRTGKHNLTEYDWKRYMDFADKHWKRK